MGCLVKTRLDRRDIKLIEVELVSVLGKLMKG